MKNKFKLFLLDLLDENVYFNLSKLGLKKTTFVFLCCLKVGHSCTLVQGTCSYTKLRKVLGFTWTGSLTKDGRKRKTSDS